MNIKRGLTSMIISTICFIYINYTYVMDIIISGILYHLCFIEYTGMCVSDQLLPYKQISVI